MYKKNYLSVKLGSKLTQPFKFDVGVKERDVLSPNIFKIFLIDLIAFATHFSNLILRPGHSLYLIPEWITVLNAFLKSTKHTYSFL
jgi:hypothetical protein